MDTTETLELLLGCRSRPVDIEVLRASSRPESTDFEAVRPAPCAGTASFELLRNSAGSGRGRLPPRGFWPSQATEIFGAGGFMRARSVCALAPCRGLAAAGGPPRPADCRDILEKLRASISSSGPPSLSAVLAPVMGSAALPLREALELLRRSCSAPDVVSCFRALLPSLPSQATATLELARKSSMAAPSPAVAASSLGLVPVTGVCW
mmetsp:Transcript_56180/g.131292  ORF Transcript_56180/g.131292 Transcript_56180/m.131292 type:complete len:208 (+) Transcript_56180:162-785(+)